MYKTRAELSKQFLDGLIELWRCYELDSSPESYNLLVENCLAILSKIEDIGGIDHDILMDILNHENPGIRIIGADFLVWLHPLETVRSLLFICDHGSDTDAGRASESLFRYRHCFPSDGASEDSLFPSYVSSYMDSWEEERAIRYYRELVASGMTVAEFNRVWKEPEEGAGVTSQS